MSMEKKVKLMSRDNEIFEVKESVLHQSPTLKNKIDDIGVDDNPIPLLEVSGIILSKVIMYCEYHEQSQQSSAEEGQIPEHKVNQWDAEFVKVDQPTLFGLIMAATYLDIEGLLELTCQTVAGMMIGKTAQEIRDIFNLQSDFTPEEEEEQIRRGVQWNDFTQEEEVEQTRQEVQRTFL